VYRLRITQDNRDHAFSAGTIQQTARPAPPAGRFCPQAMPITLAVIHQRGAHSYSERFPATQNFGCRGT